MLEARDTVIRSVEEINGTTFLPADYISQREHQNLMEKQAEISFKVGKTAGVAESLLPALKAIDESRKAGIREVLETTVYLALAKGHITIREIFELHPERRAQLKKWQVKED